jgi:hypothetical protein
MGLLDDAIREHLELQRRRGADPSEVERAEQEALGPVRRFPDAPPEANAAVGVEEPEETLDEPEETPEAADVGQPTSEVQAVDEPHPSPVRADRPPPEAEPTTDQLEQETSEYELHERPDHDSTGVDRLAAGDHESEGGPIEDDDVLEETPEFLQDAPEHDRLWFEQRPPRDFDFDG